MKTYKLVTVSVLFLAALALAASTKAQTSNNTLMKFVRHVEEGRQADAQKMLDAAFAGKETMDLEAAAAWVAIQGDLDLLRQLLDHGIDPEAPSWSHSKKTMVNDVLSYGQVETLRLLLDRGARPQPYLYQSAELKSEEAVKLLLDRGARTYYTYSQGGTALHAATERKVGRRAESTLAIVRLLISRGAQVNVRKSNGQTPLFYAARNYPAVVQLLLDHGADPNLYTDIGLRTPLARAIHAYVDDDEDKVLMVRLLLEAGADPNIKVHFGGSWKTPLELAWNNTKIKELLREYGATAQGKNWSIQEARKAGKVDEIRTFLDAGFSENTLHDDGCPIIHHAISDGQMEVVQLLLERGADVHARNTHQSPPLLIATEHQDDPAYVRLLLSNGADVNATCIDADTPLHILAMFQDNLEVAQVLLDAGVNINARNNSGQTAYDIAKSKGHMQLAEMLLENDPNR